MGKICQVFEELNEESWNLSKVILGLLVLHALHEEIRIAKQIDTKCILAVASPCID